MATGACIAHPESQWVTFADHSGYIPLTLAWSSECKSTEENCASFHIFCALYSLRVNMLEQKNLGFVLKLCKSFCFMPFFLQYLEFSICLQWKYTHTLFHPGYWPIDWPLNRNISQRAAVLSRTNSGSPQPEFFPHPKQVQHLRWGLVKSLYPHKLYYFLFSFMSTKIFITHLTFCILNLKAAFKALF